MYLYIYIYKCCEKFSQIRMSQNSGPKKSLVSCWKWSLNMMISHWFPQYYGTQMEARRRMGAFWNECPFSHHENPWDRFVNPLPLSSIHTQRLYSWKKGLSLHGLRWQGRTLLRKILRWRNANTVLQSLPIGLHGFSQHKSRGKLLTRYQ